MGKAFALSMSPKTNRETVEPEIKVTFLDKGTVYEIKKKLVGFSGAAVSGPTVRRNGNKSPLAMKKGKGIF